METIHSPILRPSKAGFSLIEMLVVIAVIGIIAAMVIPNIGGINASGRKSTAQRNAQTIASTYSAALAAGVPPATIGGTVPLIVGAIAGGTVSPSTGPFSGQIFTVPNVPASGIERTEIEGYLTLNSDGTLAYRSGQ